MVIDFPDHFGQERESARIPEMPAKAKEFGASATLPALQRYDEVGLSIREVAHSYGELQTIEELDLEVPANGVLGLVGPSGCGKSTLLELIAGLQEPLSGRIEIGDAGDGSGRLAHCALMPQRDLLLPWLNAIDNAALALRNRGTRRGAARREAAGLFARFGLSGFEQAKPAELSGGMRQRVAFLRTLVAGKPVIALDEPFASLDAITRAEMQSWLAGALDADPRTVVLVTHDVEEALYLCDRVAVLSARPARIVEELSAPAPRAPDRDEAVTDPEFVAARERAMHALHKAGGGDFASHSGTKSPGDQR
jgi:ABC-type nitrate/sulfonate/bicarbonate transport system ATPase subunit